MVFPGRSLPLPSRSFPFHPSVQVLPVLNTRLPLSPYCNPLPALLRQPRCFPPQNDPILSLFCKYGFQKQYSAAVMAMTPAESVFFPLHTHSRQATLHTAHDSVHRLAGSYLTRTRTESHSGKLTAVAQKKVSTETGSYIPCRWDAPGILNPQHPP